jgi:peptidyl-prolyl cis-trans isomerase C
MKNQPIQSLRFVLLAALMTTAFVCNAQTKTAAVATVNGVAISKDLFDLAVKSATPPGQQPNAVLENDVRQRLINIELLAQEAVRLGLEKSPENQIRLRELRQTFLGELLLADYFAKNPITEDQMRAEYNRQLKNLGIANLEQYKLNVIALSTDVEAAAVIAQIKSGEPFAKAVKEKSIDPTKEQGGQAGWVLPAQVNSSIASVMTNLPKGGMSSSPIQTPNGWYIIQLEDKRPFQPPPFEEIRNQIRTDLVQQKQAEILTGLREKAKITQ